MWPVVAMMAASSALSAIGGMQSSRKQAELDKEKLNLARQQMKVDNFWNQQNYNNQVQTYNENLADKYRGRGSFEQGDIQIGCFGQTTAKAVKDAGLRLDLEAPTVTAPSMTTALDHFIKAMNGK